MGGNVGDVPATLREALRLVGEAPGVRVARVSGRYRTSPVGPVPQADFLNAAAELVTSGTARELLQLLLGVERTLGRDRSAGVRWGPRPLDLDLLVFGDAIIAEPDLEVPHPRMTQRRFVLEPLAEIAPDLVVPGTGRTVRSWRDAVEAAGDRVTRESGAEII